MMSVATTMDRGSRDAPYCEAETALVSRHVPALDGIRGLAILMVTAYRFNLGPEYNTLPGSLLFRVLSRGHLGVDLFFVLSGFLITGILFDAKDRSLYFRTFYARRALRIFPLYYGFLFVTLVVLPKLVGATGPLFAEAQSQQAWLWSYGVNVLMGIRDEWCPESFVHFWSLSVEEHFYLLWPLIIFLCSRRQAIFVSLLAVVLSLFGRMAWLWSGGSPIAAETFTFFRMDGLGVGALLALWARGPRGLKPLTSSAIVGLGLCAAIMLAVAALGNQRSLGVSWTAAAGFFGALLVLAVAANPSTAWGGIWSSRGLKFFGKHSYAMYVFQLPLIALLTPIVTADSLCSHFGSVFGGRVAYLAIMSLITTVAAVLSWHFYEKHFLRLKALFPTSHVATRQAETEPLRPPAAAM
jgi:peptidoglycan/LPS O-acetylase OafA/YrhL